MGRPAFVNNGRVPSVGSIRRGVELSHGSLLGFGDRIEAIYTNTEGSNAGDFAYRIPFNGLNGTFELRGGLTSSEVVESPFDRLDIKGESYYWTAGFRQPIIRSPTQELAVGFTLSSQTSQSEILGVNFPLSPGADENGRTRVTALRISQDWTRRSSRDVFAARSQFSLGLNALGANDNPDPPDSEFFAWRGQGQYVRRLARDALFVVRTDLQLSDRTLLSQEQFSLGGLNSIRGYRQDALLTDSGWFISAETALPIFRIEAVDGVFQIVPFIDYGVGWNIGDRLDPNFPELLGVGVGGQLRLGNHFSARLDWGIPLLERPDRNLTLQEQGLYFSIQVSPL